MEARIGGRGVWEFRKLFFKENNQEATLRSLFLFTHINLEIMVIAQLAFIDPDLLRLCNLPLYFQKVF